MDRETTHDGLTDSSKRDHAAALKAVAHELGSLPSILKGGSALILCYGHTRFSEDLDYNACKHYKLDGKIRDALRKLGATQVAVEVVKDTATTLRYRATYSYQSVIGASLKVETSFRAANDVANVTTIDGIRVYTIDALATQKLAAIHGRTASRDLEDVRFILENHRGKLQDETLRSIQSLVGDGTALIAKYESAYDADHVLTDEDLLSTVAGLVRLTR